MFVGGTQSDYVDVIGDGNHVVIGDEGNDFINASNATNGRHILIGGPGADQLRAGDFGDIIITGTLSPWASILPETGLPAMFSYPEYMDIIRSEWISEQSSFADRVDQIFDNGIGNSNLWSRIPMADQATPIRLSNQHPSNVLIDADVDEVFLGTGDDWLFWDDATDIIDNINPLDANEQQKVIDL